MDKKLHEILRLYGESPPADSPESDDLVDLQYVKSRLDERPRVSAPEEVIRNVLYFAADEGRTHRSRQAANRPARRRERAVIALAGSSVAMLIVATMFFLIGPEPEAPPEVVAVAEVAVTPRPVVEVEPIVEEALPTSRPVVEPRQRNRMPDVAPTRVRPAPPHIELASVSTPSPSPRVVVATEISDAGLAWDDGQDLRRVHHMINVIQARSDEFDWDEPAVPLDLVPGSRSQYSPSGVHPAGGPAPHR